MLRFGARRETAKKGALGDAAGEGGGGCMPRGSPSQLVPGDGATGGCSKGVPSLRAGCFSAPRRAPVFAQGEPQRVSPRGEHPRRSGSARGFPGPGLLCIRENKLKKNVTQLLNPNPGPKKKKQNPTKPEDGEKRGPVRSPPPP